MASILLVDDDEILVEIMADHLQAEGHMVSVVYDGTDVLRAVHDAEPDLLVLDYNLPGLSGLEILRELRSRPYGKDLPILMLTAKTGRLLSARALQDGVDDYLIKPVTPDLLLRRIEALLLSAAFASRSAHAAR